MKKALGLVALGMLCTVLVAANAEQAPEKITLKSCGEKQAPVTFDHKAHGARTECKTCHHNQADLTAATVATLEVTGCTECHLKPEKAETPGCTEMSLTKNIFHIKCVTCHKEAVKADAAVKAPTKCTECHPKA